MRKKNTEPLKEVIDRYLKAIGADKKLKEIKLVRQWEEIIGRNIAMATEDIFIRNGTLYIKFKSPVVKYEVSLIKSGIIKKVNETAKEEIITDIILM